MSPRCRSGGWRRCRRGRGRGCGCGLRLERANINPIIQYTRITRTALIVIRRRSEAWIAGINRRTSAQQRMCDGRTPVFSNWGQHRVRAISVSGRIKVAAGIVAAQVVSERVHCAVVIEEIGAQACGADIQDCVPDRDRRDAEIAAVIVDPAAVNCLVPAKSAVLDRHVCFTGYAVVTNPAAAALIGGVDAERAIAH